MKMVLGVLGIVALALGAAFPDEGAGWVRLFDGETLAGWRVAALPADREAGFWKAEDGAIVCDSIGRKDHDYVWLATEREYGDFELKLQFQAFRDSPGNSGVQVRSRYDDGPEAPRGGWLDGPQVDVHPPAPWRTGLIYDETRGHQRWIAPSLTDWRIDESHAPEGWRFRYADEGWNDLHILCEGTRIRTIVNGVVAVDYDGAGVLDDEHHERYGTGLKGHIALQLHDKDELRIRYRELWIREITE